MMKPARTRAVKPDPKPVSRSLEQQQTDFTSEGSPMPGKVATTVPAVTPAEAQANLQAAATGGGAAGQVKAAATR